MVSSVKSTPEAQIDLKVFEGKITEAATTAIQLYMEGMPLTEAIPSSDTLLAVRDDLLPHLRQNLNEVDKLLKMAKSTEALASSRLQQQCQYLKDPVEICIRRLIGPLYAKFLNFHIANIEENFARALEKLNAYRAKRTQTNYSETSKEIKDLQQRKKLLVTLSVPKEPSFTSYVEKTATKIFSLSTQIDPSVQIQMATLIRNVQHACENGVPMLSEDKEKMETEFNAQIAKLPQDVQDRLDWWIYTLALPPKGGPSWGYKNRFKDLNCLKEALKMLHAEKVEKDLREMAGIKTEAQLSEFYLALYDIAFGPPSPNPVDWAKKELVFLSELVPMALDRIQNKTDKPVFFFNQIQSLMTSLPRSV